MKCKSMSSSSFRATLLLLVVQEMERNILWQIYLWHTKISVRYTPVMKYILTFVLFTFVVWLETRILYLLSLSSCFPSSNAILFQGAKIQTNKTAFSEKSYKSKWTPFDLLYWFDFNTIEINSWSSIST